ncbi:NB-ARC domain, LRR domain containing protein, partial [Parasponia andersonii]
RFLKEDEVVGLESPKDELVGWLTSGKPQRTVISVVGMGGLGKTTLVQQVYDRVKGQFDCHAWISVSQSYKIEELLRNLMKKFCESKKEIAPSGIDEMDEETLTARLREYLPEKNYLVVLDDVWKKKVWGDLQHALLDNNKVGRIVMTTRKMSIAYFCKTSSFVHVLKLQPLAPKQAWELFCKKVFKFEFKGSCPPELEKLSGEIVERCKGLPLAIVTIAGLLSTKDKTVEEWQKLHASLNSELMNKNSDLESITRILSLSYNDLPYYLKSCFLYFGVFPEDYSVRCGRLIRLWIAEGFVTLENDKTLEVIAQEYMTELINRSLVQVSWEDFDGKTKKCRVHDLLRGIILRKLEDLSFCQVLSDKNPTIRGVTRRLSILNNLNGFVSSENSTVQISRVRCVFIFNKDDKMPNSIVSTCLTRSRLLKVLDFEDTPRLDHLPEDIGELFHLRYLSLRGTQVKTLPKSIGKLVNLETLDLKQSLVHEIPAEINELRKLRHLLVYYCDYNIHFCLTRLRGVKMEASIGCLKALQKLYYINIANGMGVYYNFLKDLGNLTELRKLGILKLRSEDGSTLCQCIEKMEHLQTLSIGSMSEDEILNLESMSPPQFLRRLYLKGRLEKFPEWITKLQNLVRIRIHWSKLEDDLLKILQNLHINLLELAISSDAYIGEKLHFEKGARAFAKLKVLRLTSLTELKSLVIEEGALPLVSELEIGPSPQLKEVPSGIQHLKSLELLSFYDMANEFVESMIPGEGPCYKIVEHVPVVLIHYKNDGGRFETYYLR